MGTSLTWICAAAILAVPSQAAGQSVETGFLNRSVVVEGDTYRYQVYVPAAYDRNARSPVILFLHGAGERGDDGLVQTEVGLGSAIRRQASRFPAVVVFPQARRETNWLNRSADVALAALDRTLEEFNGDASRVYLTGLSMGGKGAWSLAYQHPDRFAPLAIVCGFVAGRGPFPGIVPPDETDPYQKIADAIKGPARADRAWRSRPAGAGLRIAAHARGAVAGQSARPVRRAARRGPQRLGRDLWIA